MYHSLNFSLWQRKPSSSFPLALLQRQQARPRYTELVHKELQANNSLFVGELMMYRSFSTAGILGEKEFVYYLISTVHMMFVSLFTRRNRSRFFKEQLCPLICKWCKLQIKIHTVLQKYILKWIHMLLYFYDCKAELRTFIFVVVLVLMDTNRLFIMFAELGLRANTKQPNGSEKGFQPEKRHVSHSSQFRDAHSLHPVFWWWWY